MADREIKRWITVNGNHIPIYYEDEVSEVDKEQALKKLDKLKPLQNKNPDIINTPLRMDGNIGEANRLYVNHEFDGEGEYKDVDVNELHTLQLFVVKSAVRNTITRESAHEYANDTPVAIDVGGEIWLIDGNHRASAAKLLGQKSIRVKVFKP